MKKQDIPEHACAVLDFWFGVTAELDDLDVIKRLYKQWFMGGASFDADINTRFSGLIETALAEGLDGWDQTAKGALANIIVLDQFTRNIYRGTARAFAGDSLALALSQQMIARGTIDTLHPHEQVFAAMPYQHSESLQEQRQSVDIFKKIAEKSPDGHEAQFENTCKSALLHLEIIEKYGRFPHRNKALDRPSSDGEKEYLQSDATRFGQ